MRFNPSRKDFFMATNQKLQVQGARALKYLFSSIYDLQFDLADASLYLLRAPVPGLYRAVGILINVQSNNNEATSSLF